MNSVARSTTPLLLIGALAAAFLVGCSSQPTPEPTETPPVSGGSSTQDPCIVGVWTLDVEAYRAVSEEYLLGLPLPIEGFDMTGFGTLTFTADGLVTTDVDLTSTGTIVAGDTRVPFNTPGRYMASGDWALGSDGTTIDLANWSTDLGGADPLEPESPGAPPIDFTDIPHIASTCTEHELELSVTGAPFPTRWYKL